MHNAVPNENIEKVELHLLKFQTKGNPRRISKVLIEAIQYLVFLYKNVPITVRNS